MTNAEKYLLCYVDGNKAYFTSDWEHQWGDDWNDAPYEHNAGTPYEHYFEDGIEHSIDIKEIYFELNMWYELPCSKYDNSPFSVEDINNGAIAWIITDSFHIKAKTTYTEFINIVTKYGGKIYEGVELNDQHRKICKTFNNDNKA